eukprot:PhM_4_TR15654/c7_g1_i1/m.61299
MSKHNHPSPLSAARVAQQQQQRSNMHSRSGGRSPMMTPASPHGVVSAGNPTTAASALTFATNGVAEAIFVSNNNNNNNKERETNQWDPNAHTTQRDVRLALLAGKPREAPANKTSTAHKTAAAAAALADAHLKKHRKDLEAQCSRFVRSLNLESGHHRKQQHGTGSPSNSPAAVSIQSPAIKRVLLNGPLADAPESLLRNLMGYLPSSQLARTLNLVSKHWQRMSRTVLGDRRTKIETWEPTPPENNRSAVYRVYKDGYSVVRYSDACVWEGPIVMDSTSRCGSGTLTFPRTGIFEFEPEARALPPDLVDCVQDIIVIKGQWADGIFITGTVFFRNGTRVRVVGTQEEYNCFGDHVARNVSKEVIFPGGGGSMHGVERVYNTSGKGIWTAVTPSVLRGSATPIPKVALMWAHSRVVCGWLRSVDPRRSLEDLRSDVENAVSGLPDDWSFQTNSPHHVLVRDALPRNRAAFMDADALASHPMAWAHRKCGWPSDVPIVDDVVAVLILALPPCLETKMSSVDGFAPNASFVAEPGSPSIKPAKGVRSLKDKVRSVRERIEKAPLELALDAAREGSLGVLIQVLDKHPHLIDAQLFDGRRLIHHACDHGQADVVEYLIKTHKVRPNVPDSEGRTPLHYAAAKGQAEAIAALFKYEEVWQSMNVQDVQGNTALHLAVARKLLNTALWIVEQGARVDLENAEGFTAAMLSRQLVPTLDELVKKSDVASVRALLRCLPTRTVLKALSRTSHTHRLDIDQHVLDDEITSNVNFERHDAHVEPSDVYGMYLRIRLTAGSMILSLTPTLSAVGSGALCPNICRTTVLHHAVELQNVQMVSLLLQCAAIDANVTNASGQTALHRAACIGHIGVLCHLLYDARTLAGIQDVHGRTPLHWAVVKRHYKAAALLIHRMTLAEVQLCDDSDMTALQYAASICTPGARSFVSDVMLNIKSLEFEPTSPFRRQNSREVTPFRWFCDRKFKRKIVTSRQHAAKTSPPPVRVLNVYSNRRPYPALSCVISDVHDVRSEKEKEKDDDVHTFPGLTVLCHAFGCSAAAFPTTALLTKPKPPRVDPQTGFNLAMPSFVRGIVAAGCVGNAATLQLLLSKNETVIPAERTLDVLNAGHLACCQMLLQHPYTEVPVTIATQQQEPVPLALYLLRRHGTFAWFILGLQFFQPSATAAESKTLFPRLVDYIRKYLSVSGVRLQPLLSATSDEALSSIVAAQLDKFRRPHLHSKFFFDCLTRAASGCRKLFTSTTAHFTSELACFPDHALAMGLWEAVHSVIGTELFNPLFEICRTILSSRCRPPKLTLAVVQKCITANWGLQPRSDANNPNNNKGTPSTTIPSPDKSLSRSSRGTQPPAPPALHAVHHNQTLHALRCERDLLAVLPYVSVDDEEYAEILWLLVSRRHFEGALALIKKCREASVNLHHKSDWCALHFAVAFGHTELLQALVSTGNFDVNEPTSVGFAPIHLAAMYGHTQTIIILAKYGASLDSVATTDECAEAVSFGWKVYGKLCSVEDILPLGVTPLHLAARNGFPEVVRYLLLNQADVHRTDRAHNTALHHACYKGHERVAQLLWEANPTAMERINLAGDTPILVAARGGFATMVGLLSVKPQGSSKQLLLSRNVRTGATVAHYAAAKGQAALIEHISMYERQARRDSPATTQLAAPPAAQVPESAAALHQSKRGDGGNNGCVVDEDAMSPMELLALSAAKLGVISRFERLRPMLSTLTTAYEMSADAKIQSPTAPVTVSVDNDILHSVGVGMNALLNSKARRGGDKHNGISLVHRAMSSIISTHATTSVPSGTYLHEYELPSPLELKQPKHNMYEYLDHIFAASHDHLLDVMNPESLPFVTKASKALRATGHDVSLAALSVAKAVVHPDSVPFADPKVGSLNTQLMDSVKPSTRAAAAGLIPEQQPLYPIHCAIALGHHEVVESCRKFQPTLPDFQLSSDEDATPTGHQPTMSEAEFRARRKRARLEQLQETLKSQHESKIPDPSVELRRKTTVALDALKPATPETSQAPVEWVRDYYAQLWTRAHADPVAPDDFDTPITCMKALRRAYTRKLFWACRHSQISTVDSIITLMGDANIVADNAFTPLMIACYFGASAAVKMLLERDAAASCGTKLQSRTEGMLTPLHIACHRNCVDLISVLVASSPNTPIVDLKDECGNTPMHIATARNSFLACKKLLCCDASIWERNNMYESPDMISACLRNADTNRLLSWWSKVSRVIATEKEAEEIAFKLCSTRPPVCYEYVTNAWLPSAMAYHAKLDLLSSVGGTGSAAPPPSSVDESIPCLLYHKVCRAASEVPARSVVNQLVFCRWPEHVRALDMGGTYIGPRGISNILQLLTVLPGVESLDLSGNRLENSSIVELCSYAKAHPGLRRLILNNNKNVSRVGGNTLLKLLKQNQRIIHVDVAATQVDVPMQEKIRCQAEENKRHLALMYADTAAMSAFFKPSHQSRTSTPSTAVTPQPGGGHTRVVRALINGQQQIKGQQPLNNSMTTTTTIMKKAGLTSSTVDGGKDADLPPRAATAML